PYLLLDSANNSQEMTFSIDFNNHGVGPAIIVKKEILYNGNTYDLEFYDFLQQHVPGMDSVNVINHSTMQNGLAIPSGNKRNVITVGGDMKSYQTFLSIMSELQKNEFHYEIVYKSIYDDRWVINSITNEPNAIE
ncbi:MAG: hypothetical protein KJO77_02430, partial [Bacteroidia bacterium]|nr:hypothetical protein [Bacteroidia bacterium]